MSLLSTVSSRRIIEFVETVLTSCSTNDEYKPNKYDSPLVDGELVFQEFTLAAKESSISSLRDMLGLVEDALGRYGCTVVNDIGSVKPSDIVYVSVGDYTLTCFTSAYSFVMRIPIGYYHGKGDYRMENSRIAKEENQICEYLSSHGFEFSGSEEEDSKIREYVLYGNTK